MLYIILSNSVCVFVFVFVCVRLYKFGSMVNECGTYLMCFEQRMCTERPWYSCLNMESIAKQWLWHVERKQLGLNQIVVSEYSCLQCRKKKETKNKKSNQHFNMHINHQFVLLCGFIFGRYKRTTMTEQGQLNELNTVI